MPPVHSRDRAVTVQIPDCQWPPETAAGLGPEPPQCQSLVRRRAVESQVTELPDRPPPSGWVRAAAARTGSYWRITCTLSDDNFSSARVQAAWQRRPRSYFRLESKSLASFDCSCPTVTVTRLPPAKS